MKFERLSENKIRIILTVNDLKDKEIDFHDFMSNPLETQDLFLDILEEAKEKIGFNTSNYKVKIEALAMVEGDFIVNVTRLLETTDKNCTTKRKFKVRRKSKPSESNQMIYKFSSFDDYCYFVHFLEKNGLSNSYLIAKKVILYLYKDEYYLILDDIHTSYDHILKFYTAITEFGTYINHSMLFVSKLCECGRIVIKNNALKTSLKHYQGVKEIM